MGNQPSSPHPDARLSTAADGQQRRGGNRFASMRTDSSSLLRPAQTPYLYTASSGTLILGHTTKEAHVGRGHRQVSDHGQVGGQQRARSPCTSIILRMIPVTGRTPAVNKTRRGGRGGIDGRRHGVSAERFPQWARTPVAADVTATTVRTLLQIESTFRFSWTSAQKGVRAELRYSHFNSAWYMNEPANLVTI